MNICFASLSYPAEGETSSGVGTQIELLAQALVKAGHSVSVIDHAGNGVTRVSDDRGVRVYRMRSGKLHWFAGKLPLLGNVLALPLREIEYSIAAWRGVRRAQRDGKLDLIEGTETGMLLLPWLMKKVALVIRLHGEQYTFLKYTPGLRPGLGLRLTRSLQRIALRGAKLLVSPSEAHAREIEQELGSSHAPIVVIPNAVRTKDGERDPALQRSSGTVLYAGRIEQRKGIEILLEAAAQVTKVLPETRFVIAGGFHSSFSRSSFDALVSKLGLAGNVELLGSIEWSALSKWYQRATISVLPSYYETFGLAALEPMMFATPVVATTAGALPEVANDRTGRLVPPGDAGALAAAMIELLSDAGVRERMGKSTSQHAASFDIDRLLPVNEKLYRWSCQMARAGDSSANSKDAGPFVFLSPHADDVVLSCGGLIHSLLSRKSPVQVISVFAGAPESSNYSAFARHLHAKWGLPTASVAERWREDTAAMKELGIERYERWNYSEAPYRHAATGETLYAAYEELNGPVVSDDRELRDALAARIRTHVDGLPETAVVYCPLSLGHHVDHQVLYDIGLELAASGRQVRFYEDYPYASAYQTNGYKGAWLPTTVPINVEPKLRAANAYASQLRGLGGSTSVLKDRLVSFDVASGNGHAAERYWELTMAVAQETASVSVNHPLVRKETAVRLRDFGKFLKTFRWHHLDEMLPRGEGRCLDAGCGAGRHGALIEQRGYRWFGLDKRSGVAESLCGSADALPLSDNSVSAMVAWQVIEYLEQPELLISEAARVLEPGGVFCGSVSFLEPIHGQTYFNLSPLILERLLRRNGFADVEIKPGLNGLVLLLWTWLRRSGIPHADRLAVPLALATLGPIALLIFLAGWVRLSLGLGDGHTMRWLTQTAPLEFAGHVMFSARKKARA
jgi:glycosyltransferase involved in cell wall biosynthesis/LmbE family N-acetylglucosaminyl deacetylase/SAM-dependent methyltransferase